MNTDLLTEVAAEIRREAKVGAFNMSTWFKVNLQGRNANDEEVGENLTEAYEMQEQYDRFVEGRMVWEANDFKACDSAGCAAGTVLWVQMRKGLRYEHGTIEAIAKAELDLPGGAAEDIFRKSNLDGFEIAEIFDGLADGTLEWRPDELEDEGLYHPAGLYFTRTDPAEECTDTDLAQLANARAQVDATRKRLIADKRRLRIQMEIERTRQHLDDLQSQLRSEMDDELDDEPF